jgi:TDG/mug DNA glycosylase family protein
MDRATVKVYDERAERWAAARRPVRTASARRLGRQVARGAMRVDLGAGAGRYTAALGLPVVALDASSTMLRMLRTAAPEAFAVLGDLEALPFRRGSLHGAWANMSYLHVPRPRLPMAFAQLHWATSVGAPFDLQVLVGDQDLDLWPDDDVPGRRFAAWDRVGLGDTVIGAGFSVEHVEVEREVIRVRGRRLLSLPDTVGPGMRVLMCGLNPAVYAAERGVGFARRANRFWGAAVEAGLASVPFDPVGALAETGTGMTDLVKRATVAAREVSDDEFRTGYERVERLVRRLCPKVVCFVGLQGWRAAVDGKAVAGVQPSGVGGAITYVMPSTSGLNASSSRADLVDHLRAVRRLAAIS